MDVNAPEWEAYEAQFRLLAEKAEHVAIAKPALDKCRYYLCLYGENGLSAEEEFAFLERMTSEVENLKRLEVEADYWEEIVLFLP
jgi:hypothetical protein